jgi:hypothetical protein
MPDRARDSFLLRYYGPHKRSDGKNTFRYESAYETTSTALDSAAGKNTFATASIFRDKIGLIGATADATFDLKGAPVSSIYPGVEAHATAVQNLLEGRFVQVMGDFAQQLKLIKPDYSLDEVKGLLGADALMLGLALPDDNAHSPNEKFSLEAFAKGMWMSANLWQELARVEQDRLGN